jgi:hypothetical protein
VKNSLILKDSNLADAQMICIPLLSGLVTGVLAAADLAGIVNLNAAPLGVRGIRIRWVTTTAFGAAQALAFRVNKVYGFTAIHTTGGTAVQAHYNYQGGMSVDRAGTAIAVGDRIPLTEISSYIAATGAITGATYTGEDTDEPEVFAVGAGSTLPGVYEDYAPLGLILEKNTGLVLNNHITMGATGVGNLFLGVDAYRLG